MEGNLLLRNILQHQAVLDTLQRDDNFLRTFKECLDLVLKIYSADGRLLVAGNGGSAADAQHMVAEFVSKLATDRDPLPAEALTTDTSILTAIGNDYGYEKIFSRQIQAKARSGDVFLAISTSGNSPNILEALDAAAHLGLKSILLTGSSGGKAAPKADLVLSVPSNSTQIIQEVHILLAHTICEAVELAVFQGNIL